MGFDASPELVEDLNEGVIEALVVQNPFKMGYESTKAVAVHLAGGQAVEEMDSGAHLLLPGNVDTPEMQEIVFPDIKKWLGN